MYILTLSEFARQEFTNLWLETFSWTLTDTLSLSLTGTRLGPKQAEQARLKIFFLNKASKRNILSRRWAYLWAKILKLKLFSWGQVFKSNTSQPDIPAICGYTAVWVVKNATKRRPNLSNGTNYGRVHISWHIARSCLQNVAFPHTWCRLHRLHRIGFSFPESSRY